MQSSCGTPPNASNDVSDVIFVNPVKSSHLCACATNRKRWPFGFYLSNLFICQFCVVMIIALTVSAATFSNTIANIISHRSCEQMLRVHTGRVVAFVKNLVSLGNLPIRPFKSKTMAHWSFPLFFYLPITALIQCSRPHPAFPKVGHVRGDGAVFVDSFPESLKKSGFERPDSHSQGFSAYLFSRHRLSVVKDACKVNTI